MTDHEISKSESYARASFATMCNVVSWTSKIPVLSIATDHACGRVEAIWRYKEVRPHLLRELRQRGDNYEETTVRFFIDEIVKTADFGARRNNFKKYYVDGRRLHRLPEDPRAIMFGYW